jgi:hypothetical protein
MIFVPAEVVAVLSAPVRCVIPAVGTVMAAEEGMGTVWPDRGWAAASREEPTTVMAPPFCESQRGPPRTFSVFAAPLGGITVWLAPVQAMDAMGPRPPRGPKTVPS